MSITSILQLVPLISVSDKSGMLFSGSHSFPCSVADTIIIGLINTSILTFPPFIGFAIPHREMWRQMGHGAQPTHELGVDKTSSVFPQEILVI